MFPFFNSYSKYPFLTNQQLNLDWIMEKVASAVPTVTLPALSDDQMSTLQQAIDYNQLDIPENFSFIIFGGPLDDFTKRACVMCYKLSSDNMIITAMAFSADYGPYGQAVKYEGVWST